MRHLGYQETARMSTVVSEYDARKVQEYCHSKKISPSAFLRDLIHDWVGRHDEEVLSQTFSRHKLDRRTEEERAEDDLGAS